MAGRKRYQRAQMTESIAIRLDQELGQAIEEVAAATQNNRSQVIRDILRSAFDAGLVKIPVIRYSVDRDKDPA